jgi:hypothetical protein
MAQFETTGGGYFESEGRITERKVVIATGGAALTPPGGNGTLSNISITNEPGGVRRGIFEYTIAGEEGSATSNASLKRIELTGGTREVPIYNHPNFSVLTEKQILDVQKAVDEKQERSFTNETQQKLYEFLSRGTEYVLAPAIVGRISQIESALPALGEIAKVANPPELNAPADTFWICTAINASPVGDRYEVTREFTLSFSNWDETNYLYGVVTRHA